MSNLMYGAEMRALTNREIEVIKLILSNKMTYCAPLKLVKICEALREVNEGVEGIYIEAGVALGGTAALIANFKRPHEKLALYDVFSTIPAPSEKDGRDAHDRYEVIRSGNSEGIGGDKYYGYQDNLIDVVKNNIQSTGLSLDDTSIDFHKGLFEDTLFVNDKVAFAHIDCDWHDPVAVCIERIAPNVSIGGFIIFDDYWFYSGAKTAVDNFLIENKNFKITDSEQSLTVKRIA
ncbi:hypothetical protein JHL17_25230 [Azospirillum sp. YIM B02556]|uniref:Macrocin-O-methyltransferase (TylF) n=1 Tax=Azospirillum endophyticum TaxID=2800326 RepID=A0ABS1FBB3_9PROT|nr:TylF/MycF/NovP-related O-methyltransferase [Azospirillum endophyticum]MBK1840712.1 hypothetical protein [Azospirillum endophyticum]